MSGARSDFDMAASTTTVALLLVALCCCASALVQQPAVLPAAIGANNNNLFQTIGTCKPDDVLLHAESVWKPSKWMQVRHQVVSYPADETEQPAGLISCVQLTAQKNANVGSAIIQSGGPGQRAVAVMVKSERGHSVAWNVLVYGAK